MVTALGDLGLAPVLSVAATVSRPGGLTGQYPGPEAAARQARYAALDQAADEAGACIMLGHTLDDQAETVLLGLARGSGARSLAGMAPQSGRYLRPLLRIRRAETAAACAALGLEPWDDPHNSDPAFTRVRVRRLMPALEDALGPGVAAALARTAALLRADADVLDALAAAQAAKLGGTGGRGGRGLAGRRARGTARGHQAPAAAQRRAGSRQPARRAVAAPYRQRGRAGHRLARSALG